MLSCYGAVLCKICTWPQTGDAIVLIKIFVYQIFEINTCFKFPYVLGKKFT